MTLSQMIIKHRVASAKARHSQCTRQVKMRQGVRCNGENIPKIKTPNVTKKNRKPHSRQALIQIDYYVLFWFFLQTFACCSFLNYLGFLHGFKTIVGKPWLQTAKYIGEKMDFLKPTDK